MLSDDDLALILEGKARKLEDGTKPREDIIEELAELVADDLQERSDSLVTRGALQSQGRSSFGRANEGREGLSLFVPKEDK